MRATTYVAWTAALVLALSACGGSISSNAGNPVPADAACGGSSCGREEPTPVPLTCAGVTGVACPKGYRCIDDPVDKCDPATGAACGGICVLGEDLPQCGGLAGTPCAEGYVCVDDPADACEGGPAADCPGVCRLQADGTCAVDSECPQLDVPCTTCADGSMSCPHARCDQGKCTVDFKPCPQPQVCGGISGSSCEPGFSCVDDPTDECVPEKGGADCRGICQPEERALTCGGIAAIACPVDFECVDDPSDTCDPKNGGADCPGLCQPADARECKTDAECPALRAPCSMCADGTEACPSSLCEKGRCNVVVPMCSTPVTCGADGSACKPGYICVDDPNGKCDPATGVQCAGVCVPDTMLRPCGGFVGASCPAGYECVDDPKDDCNPDSGGADCPGVCQVAALTQCKADDDCPHMLAPCSLCADGSYACPRAQCRDGMCGVVLDACAGPGFCGGIAGFPCAPGFTCVDNPKDDCDPSQGGADCGGICVREEGPPPCGGFTGKPCPEGYECLDDPQDDCDPAAGRADCPGICRLAPSPACKTDADCPQIGAPCRLCADGSAACPRSFCSSGKCAAEFEICQGEQ
jgi:hypothetical protein